MGNDGRGDRTRMGDAKGSIVSERPNVVGRWAKTHAKPIPAAKVLVSCVDRFGPCIELRNSALSPHITGLSQTPDGARLPVEILATDL
jgi:hypothetical protein